MGKQSVEDIKAESHQLRGTIQKTLDSGAGHFSEEDYQLLKYHGTYQQDDRDLRAQLKRTGQDKAWMFMVRSKLPGGEITAEHYLLHDRLAADLGNGTLRITTRQGFQLHGILMGGLKDCIARIQRTGLTTWGACGDVVRNTMGPSAPMADAAHRDAQKLAKELSDAFLPRSQAYTEIWMNGERLEVGADGAVFTKKPPSDQAEVPESIVDEPVYGKVYLPRKFKIGIAVPPRNDVDVYTQDIGLAPHVSDGKVTGYTVLVGGGFGMSHGQLQTHPALAQPLFYVAREHVVDACVAIVTTQRDFGNREDRKRSRMKYLIEERGMEWFRNEVVGRLDFSVEPARPLEWTTVADLLGWQEQGDGKLFLGIQIPSGRIQDTNANHYRSALRRLAQVFKHPLRLTPNCNLIIYDIDPREKEPIDAVLKEHGVPTQEGSTEMRKTAHACVALPTCGLALAESERAFPGLLDEIEAMLRDLKLESEPLLVRMTGCPNGCARPYNADIAFVGRAPGKYAIFMGGAITGDRLVGLEHKSVTFEQLVPTIRIYLEDFVKNRMDGETFSKFWGRTRVNGEKPSPEQFHLELAERDKSKAQATAGAPVGE